MECWLQSRPPRTPKCHLPPTTVFFHALSTPGECMASTFVCHAPTKSINSTIERPMFSSVIYRSARRCSTSAVECGRRCHAAAGQCCCLTSHSFARARLRRASAARLLPRHNTRIAVGPPFFFSAAGVRSDHAGVGNFFFAAPVVRISAYLLGECDGSDHKAGHD